MSSGFTFADEYFNTSFNNDDQLTLKRGINQTHEMIRKICIVLLVQLACGVLADKDKDKGCTDVACPTTPKHYEELGCEAVTSGDDCCPSR